MNSTALLTAIGGAAFGAMVAYRVMRGQRWIAVGLAAIGSVILLNVVTLGKGTVLEHRVILLVSVALVILNLVAVGAASRDRRRDLGGFLG